MSWCSARFVVLRCRPLLFLYCLVLEFIPVSALGFHLSPFVPLCNCLAGLVHRSVLSGVANALADLRPPLSRCDSPAGPWPGLAPGFPLPDSPGAIVLELELAVVVSFFLWVSALSGW